MDSAQQRPISWSTGRLSAKAVCESPCSLLRGVTPSPLLLSPGDMGLFSSPSTGPAPPVPTLHVEDTGDTATTALAEEQPVLCSSCEDLGGSGLLVCSL